MKHPVLLTQAQLAEVLGCSDATIRRALATGKPLGGWVQVQVNNRVKFMRADEQRTLVTQAEEPSYVGVV